MSPSVSPAAVTGSDDSPMPLQNRPRKGRRSLRAAVSAADTAPLTRRDAKKARHENYRPELQGLRALAVLMVVSYHIWFGRVSGGVDIFLLISAFLLSLSFIRKAEKGRPAAVFTYWLHTFSRLVPAAAIVTGATLAATFFLIPRDRWNEIIDQSIAVTAHFQNWMLAAESVDYYAADHSVASPLQHFWSLSIQGQVFIAWPLLFVLAAVTARAFSIRIRIVATVLFGILFAASFAFSVWETAGSQSFAYFDTRTRLWEFALGTLLALAIPYLKLPRGAAVAAGWLGIAAMLSAGFVLDVQGAFPGYAAAWPLLAAALVIVAGQTGSPFGVDRILGSKPLVKLGDISYALYLWHWPVLVIYLIKQERESAGFLDGAAIVGVSLILAWITAYLVERPLRRLTGNRPGAALLVLIFFVSAATGPALYWQAGLKAEAEALAAQADRNNPGAFILLDAYEEVPDANAVTLPQNAPTDWASPGEECTGDLIPTSETVAKRCLMNTVDGTPEKTILVLGSSHSQQWLGAVMEMADKHNYQVISAWHGGCPYGAEEASRAAWCNFFNEEATGYALELKPDLVFTVGTAAHPETNKEIPTPGIAKAANVLQKAGIQVLSVRDNPRFAYDVYKCVQEKDVEECTTKVDEKLNPKSPEAALAAQAPDMGFIDMTDMICPEGICSPVIGNVYVYMDTNHLSKSYTRSTAPVFEERFLKEAGWI